MVISIGDKSIPSICLSLIKPPFITATYVPTAQHHTNIIKVRQNGCPWLLDYLTFC